MRQPIPKAFGQMLRQYREQKGWSQLKLAEKAELSLNAIGMFERGERSPSLDTVFKLCRVLGVPPGEMITEVARELAR